ncbi:MAG: hypothetical protein HOW71_45805 [Nonomuraea sp.]|nr:hypothetical protein [Nonomuraea sp.]NUP69486.1 hypothetical protein [Nonomuraea sp.]
MTGQWAPMPRREDGPPSHGPQPEPFETTGAFALPTDPPGGFTPSNDPAGAFPPPPAFSGPSYPEPMDAGPFEVTGAFARPADWDSLDPAKGPHPDAFGGPPSFDASGRTTGPFDEPGPFDRPGSFDRPGPFDRPARNTGPFDAPAPNTGPFGGPGPNTGPFGGPGRATGPFDAPDADRTARFDAPSGPGPAFAGEPPEPGDIKVAGEPTAVHTPAWAEAESGFMRSGWSSDNDLSDLDEPEGSRGRRRGRRKGSRGGGGGGGDDVFDVPSGSGGGKGKGRMALLSVAAVAVVLGGTVAGVKLMSSPGGTEKCAEASCAAVQTSTAPSPTLSGPEESEPAEDDPAEEATEETSPSDTPSPTTTYSNRAPRRSTTPTPKPTRTKAKKTAEPQQDDELPADDLPTEEPTEDPTSLDNSDTGVVPTVGSSAQPTNTAQSAPSGGSVNVRQTVKQRITTYSATLHVTNQSKDPLEDATFSVPVEGRVMDVDGASWTQDGDLLIVDLSGSLAAGDSVDVTYSATGKAQEPGTCGLVGGECSVA